MYSPLTTQSCTYLMVYGTQHTNVNKPPTLPDSPLLSNPLGDDKVSMLTHTYAHKPPMKIKVTICNHQADSPLHVWPDV